MASLQWHVVEKYLKMKLDQARNSMDDSTGEETLRLQGEARLLKKLLNLPEALALLDQEDKRVADEKAKEKKS